MDIDSSSVFVARQPILDRHQRLVAYELLFRSSLDAGFAEVGDASLATARVALDAFLSMGISTVLGPHRGFLNVDQEMLASEAIEALPADRIVLEVLETVPPWARARCQELRARGFQLALDDYVPDDERAPLLDSTDYVKVDLVATDPQAMPALVRDLGERGVCVLAEKVETREEFETCRNLGFDLFQGYFFARPTTLTASGVHPERSGLLAAFRAISEERALGEVEDVFKRNARLGVQLLRLANSAALGSIQKITSFQHAVMYVGRRQLRRWILLMLYASDDERASTNPALELAALRGRLLELLAPLISNDGRPDDVTSDGAFLAGMLSLGDTILGAKLGDVLDDLQVDPAIRSGVLEYRGSLGQLLRVAEACEAGRFAELAEHLDSLGLSVEHLAHAQREALLWYRQIGSSDAL